MVLFDAGLGPPSERSPIREGRVVVVVGVPDLLGSRAATGIVLSKNGLPHVVVGIDAWGLSF